MSYHARLGRTKCACYKRSRAGVGGCKDWTYWSEWFDNRYISTNLAELWSRERARRSLLDERRILAAVAATVAFRVWRVAKAFHLNE
uniref:Uncharacterized protein n=1 Tax=Pristionchus pacificus TaxID=54126 RepID=A0A2A6C7M3_PRIPA|eukprot:PDM74107.1 hypothetical protein PRIPAC_41463 [Pristionchus pacificus]